ncbi:uncharacterized protein N7479_003921 [Penicillium vulpinum]|uniref:Uncharacterized protein n=1 Tax=Penicillium vulpinum TaxID=29845 RepID=A0A1V6RGV6_9EURO|nr:uncharacterized protein N7479_003921 [Penicillium vulpinum]KAJ5964045.1 hypothetical protein N7479_003921 [Penicillium vulpinum]OQE00856.1 hypothetical protein PENVUL_c045G09093 [Penicillium vulpinum]
MGHITYPEPESALSRVAFHGDLDQVSMLLDNGENYRSWDKSGWTALHWAVIGGHLHIVRKLLEHHSKSEQTDLELYRMTTEQVKSYTDGPPPILLAAERRNGEKSIDVEIFCELAHHLETPRERLRVAKFNIIWKQGKFDTGQSRFSANLWRILGKDERCNGLECRIPSPYGYRSSDLSSYRSNESDWKSKLLLCAIRDSQWSVMEMLIKAVPDANFDHALHVAAFRSDPRYVQCLMQHGADVNFATLAGRTALHEAVMNGFLDTITALVNSGADVNQQQTSEYWDSPRHPDCRLTTEGFDFWLTRKGASTLMQACGFLLSRNARFRQRNSEDTQLPEEKSLDIVRCLLSKGADPMLADSFGMTVLHYAVLQPHVSLIELLVQSGASVEALDHEGRTPLHYFARCDDNINMQDLEQTARLLCRKDTTELSPDFLNKRVTRPLNSSEEQESAVRSLTVTRTIRKNRIVSWIPENDDARTALAIALLGNRWKVADVLMRLGATFPTNIDFQSVWDNALKDLEANTVGLLLHNGMEPPPFSLMTLIRAYLEQRGARNVASNLWTRFKSILTTIVHAGADVNFCETEELSKSEHENSESDDENIKRVKDGSKTTTPLNLVASISGSREILEELLSFGADVYAVSSHTFDPILTATLFGELQDLKCLLDRASSDPRESHWSMFLDNVPQKDDAIVRVCQSLKKADSLNKTNFQGRTLLHLAVEQGNNELLAALISSGARTDILDNQGISAIKCAATARNAHAFEALFTEENDPESYNSQAWEEFRQLENEVDPALSNSQSPHVISSVLQIAPIYIFERYLGCNQLPAVYQAVISRNHTLFSFLLSRKADIEAADIYGWRPLHIACYYGYKKMADDLIAQGANVHCATQAWNNSYDKPSGLYLANAWAGTPLHLATMGGHVDIFQELLQLGVDVHAMTMTDTERFTFSGHGPTALHLALDTYTYYGRQGEALSEERMRIAQLLVNEGAMVRGMVCQMTLEERRKFHRFPSLWEALVAEDAASGEEDGQVKV